MANELPRPSNVDRSLFNSAENTFSLDEDNLLAEEQDFLNIEVEETDDGGAEVRFGADEEEYGGEPDDFYDNLADLLSPDTLAGLSVMVDENVEEDKNTRKDWEETYTKGLKLLGLKYEERSEPFEGATGVIHPILNEAVTQFQAGAYKEMIPSTGPVRANIVGKTNPEVEQQAQRVQDYMNYQIMYEMEEYEPEFDQMLYFLGLAGSSFKKVYRDDVLGRPIAKFVPAEDIVVPYSATDLRSAERVTHIIKMPYNELRKMQIAGVYRDIELEGSKADNTDEIEEAYDDLEGKQPDSNKDEYTIYECHTYLDLDEYPDRDESGEETGIKLPYIVTVCADTGDVLSVRRNYEQTDPAKRKIAHFVHYKFTPGLGFYGFGLIHLLGNLSRTATANLRQLIDAGTLSNMPAGFKARGLRIADDGAPLQPGEFRDVDVPGGDLRGALMPLPYKEPSGTLFQLLGFVIDAAQRFVGMTDMGVGDGNQEAPVGTTIALLERGSRVLSAVHKRMHTSLKLELKMLARLFAQDPAPYPYDVGVDAQIKMQDFDGRVDIIPVSDPNIFSMSQRVILAQEQLKLAQAAPEMHNMHEAYRRMYEALGVNDIDNILTPQEQPQPTDPSTENQKASQAAAGEGQLQAFPDQDHDAHIAVHQAYMMSQVAQQQPQVLMVIEKHIYEHLGMKAQMMHDQQMAQDPQAAQQPPEAHAAMLAKLQAQVFQEYQQQQPPQQPDDPLVEIKKREVDLREQQMQMDAQLDQERLQQSARQDQQQNAIARERIDSQEDIANMRAQIARERQRQQVTRQGGQS